MTENALYAVKIQRIYRGYSTRGRIIVYHKNELAQELRLLLQGPLSNVYHRKDLQEGTTALLFHNAVVVTTLPNRPIRNLPKKKYLLALLRGVVDISRTFEESRSTALVANRKCLAERMLMKKNDLESRLLEHVYKSQTKHMEMKMIELENQRRREMGEVNFRQQKNEDALSRRKIEHTAFTERAERERMFREELLTRKYYRDVLLHRTTILESDRELMIREDKNGVLQRHIDRDIMLWEKVRNCAKEDGPILHSDEITEFNFTEISMLPWRRSQNPLQLLQKQQASIFEMRSREFLTSADLAAIRNLIRPARFVCRGTGSPMLITWHYKMSNIISGHHHKLAALLKSRNRREGLFRMLCVHLASFERDHTVLTKLRQRLRQEKIPTRHQRKYLLDHAVEIEASLIQCHSDIGKTSEELKATIEEEKSSVIDLFLQNAAFALTLSEHEHEVQRSADLRDNDQNSPSANAKKPENTPVRGRSHHQRKSVVAPVNLTSLARANEILARAHQPKKRVKKVEIEAKGPEIDFVGTYGCRPPPPFPAELESRPSVSRGKVSSPAKSKKVKTIPSPSSKSVSSAIEPKGSVSILKTPPSSAIPAVVETDEARLEVRGLCCYLETAVQSFDFIWRGRRFLRWCRSLSQWFAEIEREWKAKYLKYCIGFGLKLSWLCENTCISQNSEEISPLGGLLVSIYRKVLSPVELQQILLARSGIEVQILNCETNDCRAVDISCHELDHWFGCHPASLVGLVSLTLESTVGLNKMNKYLPLTKFSPHGLHLILSNGIRNEIMMTQELVKSMAIQFFNGTLGWREAHSYVTSQKCIPIWMGPVFHWGQSPESATFWQNLQLELQAGVVNGPMFRRDKFDKFVDLCARKLCISLKKRVNSRKLQSRREEEYRQRQIDEEVKAQLEAISVAEQEHMAKLKTIRGRLKAIWCSILRMISRNEVQIHTEQPGISVVDRNIVIPESVRRSIAEEVLKSGEEIEASVMLRPRQYNWLLKETIAPNSSCNLESIVARKTLLRGEETWVFGGLVNCICGYRVTVKDAPSLIGEWRCSSVDGSASSAHARNGFWSMREVCDNGSELQLATHQVNSTGRYLCEKSVKNLFPLQAFKEVESISEVQAAYWWTFLEHRVIKTRKSRSLKRILRTWRRYALRNLQDN